MNHLFLVIITINLSLISRIKRKHIDSFIIDGNEFLFTYQVKTCDLRFPKLKALMAKQHFFCFAWNVNDLDVKRVHVNGFETDYELFEFLSLVPDDVDVCVCDVKFVFPF